MADCNVSAYWHPNRCLFCERLLQSPIPNGATCADCNVSAYWHPDRGRWKVYLPSAMVPTSDWTECPACEGSGRIECADIGCSYDDHGGPCGTCRALGVVRGTLDHPTTQPPQETR